MSLGTITLTADLDDSGLYVTLVLACDGMTTASIFRVAVDGSVAVRGAYNVSAEDALVTADYEAPQNTSLTYFARVTDGVSTLESEVVVVDGVVNRGGDALLSLTNPLVPLVLNVKSFPEYTFRARREILEVVGRADPIAVSDTRLFPSGQLTVITLDDAQRDALHSMLAQGNIIGFSPWKPSYGFTDIWYLSVGDVVEQRITPLVRHGERYFVMDVQRVSPPPADFVGPGVLTWGDAYDTMTWQDPYTAGETWLSIMVI